MKVRLVKVLPNHQYVVCKEGVYFRVTLGAAWQILWLILRELFRSKISSK